MPFQMTTRRRTVRRIGGLWSTFQYTAGLARVAENNEGGRISASKTNEILLQICPLSRMESYIQSRLPSAPCCYPVDLAFWMED